MYRVTMLLDADSQHVFHTCDTLDDATREALVLSQAARRRTEDPSLCWVDIRDVRNVVLKQVNFWFPNKAHP